MFQVYNMAGLQQLLEARGIAETAYNEAQNAPENAMDNDIDEDQGNAIIQRLYDAQQPWIQAAEAYRDAIQIDNNATEDEKQQARDYVGHIDRVQPPPAPAPVVGGRRRHSSSSRKSTLRRRGTTRSTKKRGTRRQRRARRGSRRAH